MLSGMLMINLQPTYMSFDQDSDEHNAKYRNAWRFCTQQEITNLLAELGVLQNSLHMPEDCLLRIPITISHEGFSKHFLKHHSHTISIKQKLDENAGKNALHQKSH